jgi:hypothetical protein
MRIGKMADPSIRATLTQSEEGVWRFLCITCLIDAGAALETAAMAATATTLSINILDSELETELQRKVGW